MQGEGILHYANGDHYEGHFDNDMKSGRGEYRYASGDTYTGEYLKGDLNICSNTVFSNSRLLNRQEAWNGEVCVQRWARI